MHGGFDRASRRDVVVLDHDHVIKADAVIDAAANQHRPFVQHTEPRHCLACLQDARREILLERQQVRFRVGITSALAALDTGIRSTRLQYRDDANITYTVCRLSWVSPQRPTGAIQAHIIQHPNCKGDNASPIAGEACDHKANQCSARLQATCLNELSMSAQAVQCLGYAVSLHQDKPNVALRLFWYAYTISR